MPRLRRVTALLVSFLLAQLTLAGTEAQCGAHGAVAARSASAREAHASMDMGSAARSNEAAARAGDCSDCEAPADRAPCGLPWSPGAPCAQMTSCIAPMVVVGPGFALEPSRGSTQAIAAEASLAPGPASAPEPPPPRA
jgi:hypothetical protein